MQGNRGESSSDQYIKKSNRWLMFLGIGFIVACIFALSLFSGGSDTTKGDTPLDYRNDLDTVDGDTGGDVNLFARGNAVLKITPPQVDMNNVVIGSQVEAIVTLKAENTPIIFLGMNLAEEQPDGFKLESSCEPNSSLAVDATCNIKVLWNPVSLRQLQNTLNIRWREDSQTSFRERHENVLIRAQSTDSKDCVICEDIRKQEEAKPKMAMGLDGKLYEVDKDGYITLPDGTRVRVTENGLFVDENGNIVGIIEPDRLPLDMKSTIMGTVSDTGDVINSNGETLGRLLGDDTIVDPSVKVLGAAVPVVSVMDDKGIVIGKLIKDGTVIGANNVVIGKPLVDGSIADLAGNIIGTLRPWGLVSDFLGKVVGGIIPDGTIMNGKNEVIGRITPSGLAVNQQGELIGGLIPRGVAVGAGCQNVGTILLNGQVRDSYDQVIGRVLVDGSVVDLEQNEIGSAVSQGLVINEKGAILGFVNSEGKAVNAKGAMIGCINPDGTVSAGKKVIGAVMAKGRVIGRGCQVLGSVYPDGVVMDKSSKPIGRVMADKYVKDDSKKIIGVVIPRGTAIANGCRLLGLISLNGQVMDMSNESVGCVTPEMNVVNEQQEIIGVVASKGIVVDDKGQVIGRVRLDGKVIDKEGNVIGCLNADGTVTTLDGKPLGKFIPTGTSVVPGQLGAASLNGIVLDANGNVTGWTALGGKIHDSSGAVVGQAELNGAVFSETGQLIGFIPAGGVVFDVAGQMLGRYTSTTGFVVDLNDERLGRVLPDMTVVNAQTNDVIGRLIADSTPFVDLSGAYLGSMQIDGGLRGTAGEEIGTIRADGSVTDKEGKIIGVKVTMGTVWSPLGKDVGSVSAKGEVMSSAKTQAGIITGNGLAVSTAGQVLGGILDGIHIAMDADGFLGYAHVDGHVSDRSGRNVGRVNPFGLVLGTDGAVIGRLIRVGVYTDARGQTVGWSSFDGMLNGKDGRPAGKLTGVGVALNASDQVMGSLVMRGTAVSTTGALLSPVTPTNTLSGAVKGLVYGGTPFVYNELQEIIGQVILPGVAVDNDGKMIGWTRFDGKIVNKGQEIGSILSDARVVSAKGTVMGTYLPMGTTAFNDYGQSVGVVNTSGELADGRGQVKGRIIDPNFVVLNGEPMGRLVRDIAYISNFTNGRLLGQANTNGQASQSRAAKSLGTVMMNGFVADLTQKIIGGVVPLGMPFTHVLTGMGQILATGDVLFKERIDGRIGANGSFFNVQNLLSGFVEKPNTYIGKTGQVIGAAAGTTGIMKNDRRVATAMPFGSALTIENMWAGGAMPMGAAVNDDAVLIGTVASDGAVLGKGNAVMARVMSDGVVVGISDRGLFTTMPYGGNIVAQGLPLHYRGHVLGRTTVGGDVLDVTQKKINRILDDGTILGASDMPLDGTIVPFSPAVSHDGKFLGTLDGEGNVVSPQNETAGKIAVNGTVKGNHYLKILGALVPEPLITNNCVVVGQSAYSGQVIDGRGNVVGRVQPDKWAVNAKGEQIGRVARKGAVISPTGDFLGRTLPDSTVVDTKGVDLGCARNDGSVVDNQGNEIGHVIERGLVLDENGNPIGRVKFDGTVVDKDGNVIGKVLGDGKGTVVDMNGNVIGHMVSRDEELLFDENGNITGTLRSDGTVFDKKGNPIFKVLPNGDIVDMNGNLIGRLNEDGMIEDLQGNVLGKDITVLRDKDGNITGIVSGGKVYDLNGNQIGTIQPDGTIVDMNGEVIGQILGDGTIVDKDGKVIGSITGTDADLGKLGIKGQPVLLDKDGNVIGVISGTDLIDPVTGEIIGKILPNGDIVDKDGNVIGHINPDGTVVDANGNPMGRISGVTGNIGEMLRSGGLGGSGGISGRRIFVGKKAFDITEKGSIVDEGGTVIGYMGEDGRPYTLGDKLLTGLDETGRAARPDLAPRIQATPEQREKMDNVLRQKREGLRGGMANRGVIKPDGAILARGRKKQDKNWGDGLERIVSSYPVDMSRMILKDKAIPAVLVRSVDTRNTDPSATAIVERHIYSESGRNIIIPAGSRLIGTAQSGAGSDHVAKLQITWERLIRPDGAAFIFSGKSGDAQGRGGVAAYLDDELLKKYGKPVLTSTVTSAISYMMAVNDEVLTNSYGVTSTSSRADAAKDARTNFIESMQEIFNKLIEESTEIPVVVYVPSGTRLTVFANEDLWLRSTDDDEEDAGGPPSPEARTPEGSNWVDNRRDGSDSDDENAEESLDDETSEDDSEEGESSENEAEYYTPADSYVDPKANSDGNSETVYNGKKDKEDISERVATPVLPKSGSSGRLF